MTTYKLTYFDIDGGRGEPVRIAFDAAGIGFEDHRISFADFMKSREAMPFRCAPVLEVEGVPVTQSNAMLRHVGKLAGLYPEDALQALYCDETMDAVEDMLHHIVRTFGLEGVADLKVYVQIRSLRGGHLDHVPADFVDRLAPNLAEHEARIADEAIVKAYYASRS